MSLIANYNFDSIDSSGNTGTILFDQTSNNYDLSKVINVGEGTSAGWKDNSIK